VGLPTGVRGALWRALATVRWVSLGYMALAACDRLHHVDHPARGVALIGMVTLWTVTLTVLVPSASRHRPLVPRALTLADVAVCTAAVLGANVVGPRSSHALPMMRPSGWGLAAHRAEPRPQRAGQAPAGNRVELTRFAVREGYDAP
jgi:hypothetical protein